MSLEYPCIYYRDGGCEKFSDSGATSFCVLGPCAHQQISNADRIRAMSDEELAKFLCDFRSDFGEGCSGCVAEEYCYSGHTGMIDWLNQPAKED